MRRLFLLLVVVVIAGSLILLATDLVGGVWSSAPWDAGAVAVCGAAVPLLGLCDRRLRALLAEIGVRA